MRRLRLLPCRLAADALGAAVHLHRFRGVRRQPRGEGGELYIQAGHVLQP